MVDQPGEQGQVLPRYAQMPPGVSSLIDMHVGKRLRQRRSLLGLSQENLGESVGVTFQQIQKCERGANRIGASCLYQFSTILAVSIAYFWDIPSDPQTVGVSETVGFSENAQSSFTTDTMACRETLDLVRIYYQIAVPEVRKRILKLARSLGVKPEA